MAKDQEAKKSHLTQFIARFGHGNKKMAKQAQSRQKMLKKLAEEAVEARRRPPATQQVPLTNLSHVLPCPG